MTKAPTVRQFWIGGILLLAALSSSAITLGNPSGAGVLGRPLDIRVQAILAPADEVADVCVSADVLYGDTKLSPGAVKATLQRATPGAQAMVRIQSSVAINEPVVTVLVRAGCTALFARRYVLLADPISEPTSPPPTAAAGGVSAAPRSLNVDQLPAVVAVGGDALPNLRTRTTLGARATKRESAALGAAKTSRAADRRSARARVRPPTAASANRASSVVRKAVVAVLAPKPTPRLELEAIDLSPPVERDPMLKLSPILLSEPAGTESARAAAGLLWKAVNASPEDLLRDNSRLDALGAEISAMRDAQTSSQATIVELTSRLEQSRQWPWLVTVLGALLALALLALWWMRRQPKTHSSFADNQAWRTQEKALHSGVRSTAQHRSAAKPLSMSSRDRTPAPLATDEADQADQADFAPSQSASRSVATEELFDIQQQADFFISLGEDEQAIQLLREHIAESQVPSALTYLDLLKIYHRQGRLEAYEQLRTEFNGLFNAGAPAFGQFSDEGRGLEFYERALGRIQALWPEPRVLDVIEQSIFREAGDPQSEVFDLEAYRELLLLYALAKDMIQREAIDPNSPRDFENTKVQALKATARHGAAMPINNAINANPLPIDQRPPASPNLGLDVNLNDLPASCAFEVSLPDVDSSAQSLVQAGGHEEGRSKNSNMVEFEALDFTPPDEPALVELAGKMH